MKSTTPRSDCIHFAKCGKTAYHHKWYCKPETCDYKKKKKELPGGQDGEKGKSL